MYNLLNVYDCPRCGKVLSDEITHGEDIDTERDKIYEYAKCNNCNSAVTPRLQDGMQCYEEVDDERARWANGFYDDLISDDY